MGTNEFAILVYEDGIGKQIHFRLDELDPGLRKKYEPFAGKIVTWEKDRIIEVNENQNTA